MQRQCHRCYLWTRIRFMINKLGNHTSSDFRSRSEVLFMSLFVFKHLLMLRIDKKKQKQTTIPNPMEKSNKQKQTGYPQHTHIYTTDHFPCLVQTL